MHGPDPVNIGTGHEITVADLASMIAEFTGYSAEIAYDTNRPDGQPRRRLDVTNAFRLFGFLAGTDLRDGLRHTIDWSRAADVR